MTNCPLCVGQPNWPTAENDWNRGERCSNCDATGERLQPYGPGLECYACAIGDRPRRAAQGALL